MNRDDSRLALEWHTWLAENLALGVSTEDAQRVLVDAGVEASLAQREIAAAQAHPYVVAARRIGRRYEWLEALADLYAELHRQSGAVTLEKRRGVSPAEFFTRYYFGHRPVVLQGFMEDWPAMRRWSLADFRERFGDVEVEIMSGRDTNPDHASQPDKHRQVVTLRDYVQRVETDGETNDFYMVPRNENWKRDGLARLREDIRAPAGIIDPELRPDMTTLLLGPPGTVTPLHHDNMNVLLGQVMGRKHVRLVPSFQRHLVYPRHGTFSAVDAASPDAARFPLYGEATVLEGVVEPGELLFLPVGWWHWVRALDVSATVTFHHFQLPGGNTHLRTPQ
ncbi:cupin-like domain-containing protein [Myxococcus sp. SDU36]|uniref:cupin-like domain-containing protein n=1 Tax=Myxococcus sp. SDU36 TaxID=2831967 RepID=UPI002542FFAE|nr:cupin-like domain-containing protein [Myxococcus sp. SDU36]WIG94985.1 cupin-like domain-containing protein [Myxococcus sp. SDU36]